MSSKKILFVSIVLLLSLFVFKMWKMPAVTVAIQDNKVEVATQKIASLPINLPAAKIEIKTDPKLTVAAAPQGKPFGTHEFDTAFEEASKKIDVERLFKAEIPKGNISKDLYKEGSRTTQEKTAKGDIVTKIYSTSGQVIGVRWQKPNGEQLSREYNEDGSRLAMYLGNSEKESFRIELNPKGQTTREIVQAKNNANLTVIYDDHGNVSQRLIEQNGKHFEIR
jgi:hypothetical protein